MTYPTLESILKEVVPNFNSGEYNYNYWDGDYQYYHNTNEEFIDGNFDNIEIIDKLVIEQGTWDEDWFVIFKYKDNYYKVCYKEGSQGMNYKFDEDTFKQVHPKTKTVTYFE